MLPASAQVSGAGAPVAHPIPSSAAATHAAPGSLSGASAGVITGVVDGAGGRPLTGVCVIATGPGGSSLAVTRSDGRYILGGLHPGGYTLHYSPCAVGGRYVDQWSGGASRPGSAATVSVASGQSRSLAPVTLRGADSLAPVIAPAITSQISAAKTVGGLIRPQSRALVAAAGVKTGAIAGVVTGGGKPLKGICVLAEGPSFNHTLTSAAGKFRVTKLRPGRYFVIYLAANYCGKNSGNWLPQYYKNINPPVFRTQPTRVRVVAGQTTNGIDAALRLGGEIAGTVRSQSGKTLSRVCIFAQGRVGRFFTEGFATSAKDGGYALHSLVPGKYTVIFLPRDCGNTGNYLPQWWRNSADQKHAVKITITRGLILRKVDAALRPGAVINGVVRGGSSHGPLLKRICVEADPQSSSGFDTYSFTVTGKDGSYRLTGLATGKYALFFSRNCGNNGNYLQVRRSISVVAGHATSGFNVVLPLGAIITGKVTGTHGSAVRGICVQAQGRGFGGTVTKRDGTYSIIALPTGRYAVEYSGGCGNPGSYAPQYFKGQDNAASATPVNAVAGHTTGGINVAMKPGGTITGVLTGTNGKPAKRACVQLENPGISEFGYPFEFSSTNNNGVYTARNLVPGLYSVEFGCFYGSPNFATQWFMGQAGAGVSDFVSAPAGVITSGISAQLQRGGFITGEVTNSASKPLSGTCVEVTPAGSQAESVNVFGGRQYGYTNSHGVYRIGPIAAASYDVQIGCSQSRNASQWYRGSASKASATPVKVTNGATTTGINGVLTAGGTISGEVTSSVSQPNTRFCVEADDLADSYFGFAVSNSHGHYTMGSLSSGTYQVTFYDCGYGRHHVPLGAATKTVTVTAPHSVAGLNEKLFAAGSISGTVRGEAAATLQAGVCVIAVPVSPNTALLRTLTGSNGSYRMNGLAPGKYQVYFGDPFCFFAGSNYAPQWFSNQSSQASATTVTVTSGHVTSAVSATLGTDGTITGTVTSHSSTAVAGECVTATPVDPVADPEFDSVIHPVIGVTASSGTYSLVGLLPGKYTVEFSVGCGDTGFRPQWWRHASSAADATIITVAANGTVTGIDAVLRHHHTGG